MRMLLVPVFAMPLVPAVAQEKPPGKPASRPAKSLGDKEAIREATGIALSTLGADLRRRLRGEEDRRGLLIGKVDEATPGARAKLQDADVLLSWDGKAVTSVAELAKWIRDAEPGTKVKIEYRRLERSKVLKRRRWKTLETKLELGQPGIRQAFGITFAVVESMIRRNLIRTDTPYGFKIKKIDDGSPAVRAGLLEGDVVMKWDGKALYKLVQIREWLARAKPGTEFEVTYSRRKKDAKLLDRKPWADGKLTLRVPTPKKK